MVPARYRRDVPEARFLTVSRSCRIALEELEWRFSASGGPGGQHANTSNTRAEVRFDVEHSPSLGPRQRARLLERVGPVVRVVASDERSQARNRDLAMQRLAARLAEGLRVETPRVATRPSRVAERNRRRGETKRLRGRPTSD
jgi:ribosome-associated protein